MVEQKNVMIVDDDPHVVKSLAFVLDKAGYEIRITHDGEEALIKIRESKPNLILLDVMMPKKNGYEVCQELRDDPELADIYIIMLTAKGQEADREEGSSAGADEFMTKPFSPMKVVERVKEVLQ